MVYIVLRLNATSTRMEYNFKSREKKLSGGSLSHINPKAFDNCKLCTSPTVSIGKLS